MKKTVETIILALEDLEKSILNSYTDDRTQNEIWGWNFPSLNRIDLSNLSKNLKQKFKMIEYFDFDKEIQNQLLEVPKRINVFKTRTLPYLFNGNGQIATPIYLQLIQWISNIIDPLYNWETIQDNKLLPTPIKKRLRAIQSELNEIIPNKDELKSQITLIKSATESAESLPVDLESLKEARSKVDKIANESASLYGKIDTFYKKVEDTSNLINSKKQEADKLVNQCEDAYKITTTKGLAGAFDLRAKNLKNSMWLWVFGLLIALGFGISIGSHRFEILNEVMKNQKDVSLIWIQIFLSILSLGAPIWFAWIATKQINQRFKLSEDYAFKASVAKAYEGYKKEAARLDVNFENRLFSSALTRLEEPPLRLIDIENHGSPWHELVYSQQFQKAMEIVPELKEKVKSLSNNTKKKVENEID